jgi:signal peptidase
MVVWLSFDKFILKSPVPSFLGYSTLTIETGSMNGYSAMVEGGEPKQVSIGDLILIKKTNDYKIGDVITFLPEGDKIPTTHRIIGYTDDGFVTKGDANNTKDTVPISKDRVLGEVIGHYPKLGKFSSWVKQEGYMYIIATLGIIVLGSFISKSSNEAPVADGAEQTKLEEGETSIQSVSDNAQTDDQTDGEDTH